LLFFVTSPMQEAYSHLWRASSDLFGEGSGCQRSSLRTFLMLVTGGSPVRGSGGMFQRIMVNAAPDRAVRKATGLGGLGGHLRDLQHRLVQVGRNETR
jgi:hypothetical protein